MQIRSARKQDIPQLEALHHERITLIRQADSRFAVEHVAFMCRLEAPHAVVLVGDQEAQPVGYISGWKQNSPFGSLGQSAGLIDAIALDAHRYHGGLGRQLVQGIRDWFSQSDVTRVIVLVPRYHAVEQAFWRSVGAVDRPNPFGKETLSIAWMQL